MGKHKRSRSPSRSKSHDRNKEDKHSTKHPPKRSSSGVWTVHEDSSKDRRRSTSPQPDNSDLKKRRYSNEDREKSPKHQDRSHEKPRENQDRKRERSSGRKKRRYSAEDQTSDSRKDTDGSRSVGGRNQDSELALNDRIHSLEEDNLPASSIIILSHPETVTIKGRCLIRSLGGTVDIFGHLITDNGKTYDVFSPDSHSLVNIITEKPFNGSTDDINDKISKLLEKISHVQVDELSRTFSNVRHPVVLLLEKLPSPALDFVTIFHPSQNLFSTSSREFGDKQKVVLENIGVSFYSDGANISKLDLKEFEKVQDWISRKLKKAGDGSFPVITVCGGQNVGKSTLARYLINSTLNQVSELAYLECDLGQTEFTAPGCVSLTKITQPVLGPPFTHHRQTLSSCFLGVLSPADDPVHYMKCLSHVYQKYKDLSLRCPLIVNTMGWNKGIGLCLFADTVRLVKPDLVVQIESPVQHKNFPVIDTQFMSHTIGWTTDSDKTSDESKSHALISLNTPVTQHMESADRYKARDQRTLNLLAYFGQCFSEQAARPYVFNSLKPYKVPWSQVAVHVAHAAVPRELIMYAMNASVVALCIVDDKEILSTDIDGYPKYLDKTPVSECIGFGIIRAIDPEKKVIYIMTPVPGEKCSSVNCLIRGSIEIPQQLMLNQKSDEDSPYVGNPKDVIGASSVKRRRHMTRRARATNH